MATTKCSDSSYAALTAGLLGEYMTGMFKEASLYVFALGSRYKTAFLVSLLCCSLWWPPESQMNTGTAPAPSRPRESSFHQLFIF